MIDNPVMNRDGLISTSGTSDLTSLLNAYRSQRANIVPRDMNIFTQRFNQTAPQGIAQVNNSKRLVQNKLMDKIRNFKPPSMMMLQAMLPKEDPVVTQTRDYFSGLYGLDDIGRIQQGELMAGYSPISGGGLYTLTGGRVGDPPKLGLDSAYQKRIDTIRNVGIPRLLKAGKDPTNLQNRLNQLIAAQAKDNAAVQQIRLQNATPQQKQTMKDIQSGKVNVGMPEQPTPSPSGPVVTGGASPHSYTTSVNIPDRGRNR